MVKVTDTKHLFPCSCHDAHYLAIDFDQEDTYPPFMWIEETAQFIRLRERIVGAFKRLTKRWDSSREIVLDVDTALKLQALLDTIIDFDANRGNEDKIATLRIRLTEEQMQAVDREYGHAATLEEALVREAVHEHLHHNE